MANKNQFVVEIDGIPSFGATKVDGLEAIKHSPSKLMRGNQPNAEYDRGNYEVGVVTVSNAEADVEVRRAVFEWHRNYVKGLDVAKRGARVMAMDAAGSTPITTYELHNCVPTDFKSQGFDATSNDPAFFDFAFQPEDSDIL
jgi:phage tail-like protein